MAFRDIFTDIFRFEVIVAGVVFVVVFAALVLALLLSRKKSPDKRRRSSHPLVEGSYALLLAALAGGIVVITALANDRLQDRTDMTEANADPAAEQVDVTAFQWCWQFDYPEHGKTVSGQCDDNNKKIPTLIVPTGEPVRFNLSSSDVIHSFWIPDLNVKRDAFPDHTNSLTLTFDEEGRWLGRCAEFCGPYHSSMHFYVRAVSPEKYQEMMADGVQA